MGHQWARLEVPSDSSVFMVPQPCFERYSLISISVTSSLASSRNFWQRFWQESTWASPSRVRVMKESLLLGSLSLSLRKQRSWMSMARRVAPPPMMISQGSCWVKMKVRKRQRLKRLAQILRNLNSTSLSMISMRQCSQRFFLSLKQRYSSATKIRNSTSGTSNAKKVISDHTLNTIISLNSIGKRGYCIFSCRIFWQPTGRSSFSVRRLARFQQQNMRSRAARVTCTMMKLMAWLLMRPRMAPRRSSWRQRQKLGMNRQKMKWKRTVVMTMNMVRLVRVLGQRISESRPMRARKVSATKTMKMRMTLVRLLLKGSGTGHTQTTSMKKQRKATSAARISTKYTTDRILTRSPWRQMIPMFFQRISSGRGQGSQYIRNSSSKSLLKNICTTFHSEMRQCASTFSFSARSLKTTIARLPWLQKDSSFSEQKWSMLYSRARIFSSFLGSSSMRHPQYNSSFFWQAEQNGSIFLMMKASRTSRWPNFFLRWSRRSSTRSFLRFLKRRLKLATLRRSGQRTLNHLTTQRERTLTTRRRRKRTARRVQKRARVDSSCCCSISILRSLLVTIHTPNSLAQAWACNSGTACSQQQSVRYWRQAPQMMMMATMAKQYSFMSQKQPTTAPPNPRKSRSMERCHQFWKGSLRVSWQQGHFSPEGLGLPGMVAFWCVRARAQSGGYWNGRYSGGGLDMDS